MASRSAFERWVKQPILRSAPPGPPSRQWLARQPQFSTTPAGLEAVAGLPTQGPAEEGLAPLPPSASAGPLPRGRGAGFGAPESYAPAAERSGRLQLSTLRQDPGIGLMGETEQEMNARLTREEVAEGLGLSSGLAKAVGAGLMTPDAAVKQHASEMKRADDAAEASFQREKTETQERLKRESDFRDLNALFQEEGQSERDAFLRASDFANAGKADEELKRLRTAREKKAEREAKAADLAEKTRKVATKERAELSFLPGALQRGEIGPQTQEAAGVQSGALTLPQARSAVATRGKARETAARQRVVKTRLGEWLNADPEGRKAMEMRAETDRMLGGGKGPAEFLEKIKEYQGY